MTLFELRAAYLEWVFRREFRPLNHTDVVETVMGHNWGKLAQLAERVDRGRVFKGITLASRPRPW